MKLLKSIYFWLAVLFIAVSVGLYFFHNLLGMENDTIGLLASLLFGFVSLGSLFIIRSFSLLRALSKKNNSDKLGKGKEKWEGSLNKEIHKEILLVFDKVKKGYDQLASGLERRKVVLLIASKKELLTEFGDHVQNPWQYSLTPGVGQKTKFYWWVNQTELYIGVDESCLSQTPDRIQASFKSLLHFLDVEGKLKALDVLSPLLDFENSQDKNLAKKYRYTIQHVMEELHLNLPVVPLVTGLENIGGFPEVGEVFLASSKTKAMGNSFAYAKDQEIADLVRNAGDEWFTSFQSQKTALTLELWKNEKPSESVFFFLENWHQHVEQLALFVEEMFHTKLQQERSFLRGIFWCAKWEAPPIEIPLDQMDLENPVSLKPVVESWFLSGFTKWIQGESSIVRFSEHRQSSMSKSSALASLVFLLLSGILISISTFSFTAGKILASDWEQILSHSQGLDFNNRGMLAKRYSALDTLFELGVRLETERPWSIAPGFYLSSKAKNETKARYDTLMQTWVQHVLVDLEAELKELSFQEDIFDKSRLYGKLKLYLLLTEMGESKRNGKNLKFIETTMLDPLLEIVGRSKNNLNQNEKKYLPIHIKDYADKFEERQEYQSDQPMVKRLRSILLDENNIEGRYQTLLQKAVDFPAITIEDLGFPENSLIRTEGQIPPAYTLAAYNSVLRTELESPPSETGDWVLGQSAKGKVKSLKEKEKLNQAIRERYYSEYTKTWQDFLANLVLEMPNEYQQVSTQFSLLASAFNETTPRGLRSFIAVAWKNVNLQKQVADTTANNALKEKALGKVANRRIIEGQLNKVTSKRFASLEAPRIKLRKNFASLKYLSEEIEKGVFDVYFSDLENLARFVIQAGSGDEATLTFVQEIFKDERVNPLVHAWNDVEERFKKIPLSDKKWLERLWLNPLKSITRKLAESASANIDRKFKEEVYNYYRSYFHGNYPFNASHSAREVSVSEVANFFNRKDGVFSNFLKDVEPFVSFKKGYPQVERWKNVGMPFSRVALKKLEQGVKLRNALFGENAKEITPFQLDFELDPSRRAEVSLKVGEEEVVMPRNTNSVNLRTKWPAEGHTGIALVIATLRSKFDKGEGGEWGLLKFLPRASEILNNNNLKGEWRIRDTSYYISVIMNVRVDKVNNPFTNPDFFKFECPPSIVDTY